MRFFTCLTDDHNLWLVALAAGLCLIGSIITFRLYRRLRAAQKGTRLAWAFMGASPQVLMLYQPLWATPSRKLGSAGSNRTHEPLRPRAPSAWVCLDWIGLD